jgi:type III restriction enzyme
VIYQSDIERTFAEQLEKNEAIKVYAKLPGWFRVSTPLGPYNPDWAVLVEKDGGERLYLVVETKGSLFADDLRAQEGAKISCGKAHFEALHVRETSPIYKVARSLDGLLLQLDARS